MNVEAVCGFMAVFFELLREQKDANVGVFRGHFIFVFILPYMDGNGRVARFLMNVMMADAGHPWSVIKVKDRDACMASLEAASVHENPVPSAKFIAGTITAKTSAAG